MSKNRQLDPLESLAMAVVVGTQMMPCIDSRMVSKTEDRFGRTVERYKVIPYQNNDQYRFFVDILIDYDEFIAVGLYLLERIENSIKQEFEWPQGCEIRMQMNGKWRLPRF